MTPRLRCSFALCIAASLLTVGCDDDDGMVDAGPDPMVDSGPGMVDAGPDDPDTGPPEEDAGPGDEAPTAAIDTPDMAVTISEGESVDFTGTCTDPEGTMLTHLWDFGGGATNSTDEDPGPVQFDTMGAYTVTYTCTDEAMNTSAPATVMVAVTGNQNTMATIDTPMADVLVAVGEVVTFEGTCVDPEGDMLLTHTWDFMGGASNVNAEDPGDVRFNTAGMYVVTYTCRDSSGGMGSDMITVTVNTAPEGVIDMPTGNVIIPSGGSVTFNATCTDVEGDTPLVHAWDFGGAAPASMVEDPGSITFGTDGIYLITYTCTDSMGLADPTPDMISVTVGTPPTRYIPMYGDSDPTSSSPRFALAEITPAGAFVRNIDVIPGGWPNFATMTTFNTPVQVSSDGRYVAFVTDAAIDNTDDLWVVDLYSAAPVAVNMTTLPMNADVEMFEWSPDGRKIAYTADPTVIGNDELFVIDMTAGLGPATTLRCHGTLPTGFPDVYPTSYTTPENNDDYEWSADSTKVYFRGELEVDNEINAYVFDLTRPAVGPQRLNPDLVVNGDVLAVYAGGDDMMAYMGDTEIDNATETFVVDTSGPGPYVAVRLNGSRATTTQEGFISRFVNGFSADGTHFAFYGDYETANENELFAADLTGTLIPGMAVRVHAPYTGNISDVTDAVWSPVPGDNRLLYLSDENFNSTEELFLVDFNGPGSTPAPAALVSGPTSTGLEVLNEIFWQPNGAGVVYVGDLGSSAVNEIWYTALPRGGAIGARTRLNDSFPTTADVDTWVVWVDDDTVVYEADPVVTSSDSLFIVDVTAPGVVFELPAPFTAVGSFPNFDIRSTAVSPDGNWVLSRGDPEEINVNELFLFDPTSPGTSTRMHPSLLGTGNDIDYVAGEI